MSLLQAESEALQKVYNIDCVLNEIILMKLNIWQEAAGDNKAIHEHNATPMTSSESLKDKTAPHLPEEQSPNTHNSLDDLEVDNILSLSKVEQQNAEHRSHLTIVSRF